MSASNTMQRLNNGAFGPPQLLALILALMTAVTLAVAVAGSDGSRGTVWLLLIGQGLVAACGGWLLNRNALRARMLDQHATLQSQALLDRLSMATQAAGIYCWELDWKTYAITWDESRLPPAEAAAASRRHFGMELGSDLFKWVHPDDKQAGGKVIMESLARGEDHAAFRYRLVLSDGSIRHIQAFARTYTDAAGKPLRSLGVSWDVTAEVQAVERAARDAAFQHQLLERLSVATQAAGLQSWEYDFRQQKVTWLDLGAGQDELPPQAIEAAGQEMFDQFVPEDLRAAQALSDAATRRRDPMISTRCRLRGRDGKIRHVQMYQRFVYDDNGQRLRALGANLDITESYEYQAKLEALSIRFGIATRAAQAGVWEWQEHNDALWWNETMYLIYGCAPETFVPTLAGAITMIHPDDLPLAHASWKTGLESGQIHVQFRVIRPDGTILHVDQMAVLAKDSHTSHRRLVGITLDVSQRMAAEQRERLLQKKLREASHQSGMAEVATGVLHNVGNVLNSLGVASSTAQARLKASQFDRLEKIADMLEQHRLTLADFLTNHPKGKHLPEYLSALGLQLRRDADDLLQEFEAVGSHVQYLCEIVQAQQSFARVGGAEEAVDVHELIETALTLKGRELKGVEIRREFGELPELLTDRYKLLQIIVNFIGNACDAMPVGESRPRWISIRARLVDQQLEVAVADSGIGIAPEVLPRIWEFGFTTKEQGHGFGLHSSAVAAQQLGGSIAAHSAGLGQGASFSVKIPLSGSAENFEDRRELASVAL
jgi:signal transduction histidine kinase